MTMIAGFDVEIVRHPLVAALPNPYTDSRVGLEARRAWRNACDQVEREDPNHWMMGWGVRVNGRQIEYLASASRLVFVDRVNDLVVKVAHNFGQTQTWREFLVYHEVLDDEARAIVPEILGVGADKVGDKVVSYTLARYVDFVSSNHPDYGSLVTHDMMRWRSHVADILSRKYHLGDLHDNNLSYTSDGCVCLVDLGISGDRPASATSSPIVQSVAASLPDWAREAMSVHLDPAAL